MDAELGFASVRVGARSPSFLDGVVAWLGGCMALGTPELAPAFRGSKEGGIGCSELDELVSWCSKPCGAFQGIESSIE